MQPARSSLVRILITASIRKGTCSQDKRGRPTNMCARPFFFIRRCLEVEAGRCGRKDITCPFLVSAPLCGASSYAPTSGFEANGLIYHPLFRAFAKHLYAPAAMGRQADAVIACIGAARNHAGENESELAACCRMRTCCRGSADRPTRCVRLECARLTLTICAYRPMLRPIAQRSARAMLW